MSAHMVTLEQEKQLRKLSTRLRKWMHPYTVKLLQVPALGGLPGGMSLTARTWPQFSKLVGLVKRIVPEFNGKLKENGVGWHYLDKTPYYYTEFTYFIKK